MAPFGELVGMLSAGSILCADRVSRDGGADWLIPHMDEVPGLVDESKRDLLSSICIQMGSADDGRLLVPAPSSIEWDEFRQLQPLERGQAARRKVLGAAQLSAADVERMVKAAADARGGKSTATAVAEGDTIAGTQRAEAKAAAAAARARVRAAAAAVEAKADPAVADAPAAADTRAPAKAQQAEEV